MTNCHLSCRSFRNELLIYLNMQAETLLIIIDIENV